MIKIGFNSYSYHKALVNGKMDVFALIDEVAKLGAEHIEFSPGTTLPFNGNDEYIQKVKKACADAKLEISSYTVGANFVKENLDEVRAEIERVKTEIDTAAALGVTRMRHDCGWRPAAEATFEMFEKEYPLFVDCCGQLADYASQFGITTSIENHGFYVQGSERVKRIVLGVNRDNFRTTLDVGNFLCVDEDPASAVMNNINIASHIHFKDFVIKHKKPLQVEGYITTAHNNYIHGAVTGDGDVELEKITSIILESGYEGYLSIEFEGWEDPMFACPRAFKNLKILMGRE
jgi:sugar phosphate isomerase/epimerase